MSSLPLFYTDFYFVSNQNVEFYLMFQGTIFSPTKGLSPIGLFG